VNARFGWKFVTISDFANRQGKQSFEHEFEAPAEAPVQPAILSPARLATIPASAGIAG
jgi:hypothetical protein